MTQGTVTYAGLTIGKGAVYVQKRGVRPDRVSVRMIPQVTAIAEIGNVVLGYGAEFLTLTDCLADKSNIWLSGNGFTGTLVFEDRRWRWSRYPLVSYHWNERDANGDAVLATEKSLRAMVTQALADIGETSIDVSAVPDDFYPEIDVQCHRPDHLLSQLTTQFGYDVCLGFGSDAVKVVAVGTGAALPSSDRVMAISQGLDPPTMPEIVRVCFGSSVAQARFKLVAVGLDTDGEVKLIDDLSYTPAAGWENESLHMENVKTEFGEEEQGLAIRSVYRWYGVSKFADGTLDLPDESGTLSDITQVLPFFDKLLEVETSSGRQQHPQPRVYGIHDAELFPVRKLTAKGDLLDLEFTFDTYRGIVMFERPMYQADVSAGTIGAAELYLEAAFRIRDDSNFQFVSYMKDTTVNASGEGYHNISEPGLFARTIMEYDVNQAVTGSITNQAALDTIAADLVTAAAGEYTYDSRLLVWYNRPMFTIRLDGITSEIKHIISDGTDGEPGHYTYVAQNMEVDLFSSTTAERSRNLYTSIERRAELSRLVTTNRGAKAND